MKRKFYKLTVMCLLISTIFMSGCEGLDPIANFMKAKNEAEAIDNDKEIALDNNKTQLQMQENELAAAAAEKAAELAAEQLKNNTNASGTITVGTSTEDTATVNTTTDQSTVGSTTDNTDLAK